MHPQLVITTVVIGVGLALVTFELIRRNRLKEEYSFLWFALSGGLILLAVWHDSLNLLSRLMGTIYPPSALFIGATLLLLALTMHYSVVISKLTEETRILAQKLARLESHLRDLESAADQGPAGAVTSA